MSESTAYDVIALFVAMWLPFYLAFVRDKFIDHFRK